MIQFLDVQVKEEYLRELYIAENKRRHGNLHCTVQNILLTGDELIKFDNQYCKLASSDLIALKTSLRSLPSKLMSATCYFNFLTNLVAQ